MDGWNGDEIFPLKFTTVSLTVAAMCGGPARGLVLVKQGGVGRIDIRQQVVKAIKSMRDIKRAELNSSLAAK